MKVCFISISDPKDKKSWSGTTYQMYTSLTKEFQEVKVIAPIKVNLFLKALLFAFNKFSNIFFSKGYNKEHSYLLSSNYAKKIQSKVNNLDCDFIFCINSSVIAYLETDIPICYSADTTFNQIKDYYSKYTNLLKFSVKESNLIEQKALDKSKCIIFPSEWAADYATNYYGVSTDNVNVVKLGANIDIAPNYVKRNYTEKINLLFLGVDWVRKGGDIMFKVFKELFNLGYDVNLTICGCTPPKEVEHTNLTIIPFLDKNLEEDNNKFNKLLFDTHLLLLPTRSECYGVVFSEASAFGIPSITTDTGGVSSIIKNGVNGFTLPLEATYKDYVKTIIPILNNTKLIEEMSRNARDIFEKELNWKVWGNKMKQILEFTIN